MANMIERILENMKRERAAGGIRNALEQNGYEVITEDTPVSTPVPVSGCGCGGGAGRAAKQTTRTPPELPQQGPQPGKKLMAQLLADIKNRKIRK